MIVYLLTGGGGVGRLCLYFLLDLFRTALFDLCLQKVEY